MPFSFKNRKNLGFAFDPSLMMISVGAIIGFRACASMLVGAILSWLIIGPEVLEQGWAEPGKNDPGALWFVAVPTMWFCWIARLRAIAAERLCSLCFIYEGKGARSQVRRGWDARQKNVSKIRGGRPWVEQTVRENRSIRADEANQPALNPYLIWPENPRFMGRIRGFQGDGRTASA